jgi:hypothetical protein
MTEAEVAESVFRCGVATFRSKVGSFPDFPKPDPETRLFSSKAIEAWVDRRYGDPAVQAAVDWSAVALERARGGKSARPASR